jgi:hypothetical protein
MFVDRNLIEALMLFCVACRWNAERKKEESK